MAATPYYYMKHLKISPLGRQRGLVRFNPNSVEAPKHDESAAEAPTLATTPPPAHTEIANEAKASSSLS